jgi:sugar O-acyltransferase (sialic acid O-acetyltransferase NeuD family)
MNKGKSGLLPLVLIGAGGHAKVVLSLAHSIGLDVSGVCDPSLKAQGIERWRELSVLGGDEYLSLIKSDSVQLLNGVGQKVGDPSRRLVYEKFQSMGFDFPALVHPSAIVDPSARIGSGSQIMAGVIVQVDCIIGENSIINTGAVIDHDCSIGDSVHVAPRAVLCGGVCIDTSAYIGSGAVVLQGINIGKEAIVGAGSALRKNLKVGELYRGGDSKI